MRYSVTSSNHLIKTILLKFDSLCQIANTMATASFVPTTLSILKKSYFEYNTRHVTSEASTPSSRKGKERNSVKN